MTPAPVSGARPTHLLLAVGIALAVGLIGGATLFGGGLDSSGHTATSSSAGPSTGPTRAASTPGPSPSPSPSPSASPSAAPSPSQTAAALVPLPKLSVTIAGSTSIKYFSVTGDNPNSLIAAAKNASERPCHTTGLLACTNLRWTFNWIERTVGTSCTVSSASYTYGAAVSFPRWTKPGHVYPELVVWWKKMISHLDAHETSDIKLVKSYLSKARQAIVGHRCSAARPTLKKWNARIDDARAASDAAEDAWPYPDYTGPGGWYGTT